MVFCCILQYFVAKSVFLQFTLFCREISFGTIYAVLRGEKFSQKLCPWRKNDKYEVCAVFVVIIVMSIFMPGDQLEVQGPRSTWSKSWTVCP